jgi:hypothetical protein
MIGATLGSSSASSVYPLSNVNILPIGKPFRFTGKASENITIDLVTAQSIDFVALVNHNLSSGATITVQAGTTSGVADFSTVVAWRQYDAFKIFTVQSKRYWKITIADSGNADAYIEVGYVLLGDSTEFGFNFTYGWKFSDEFQNAELESEYGVPFVTTLFERIRLQMEFLNLSAANATTFRTFFRALQRNAVPLFLIPDSAVNDGYFGRITSNLERTIDVYQTMDIEFVQESRGRRLAA